MTEQQPIQLGDRVWLDMRQAAAYVGMPYDSLRRHATSDPNLRSSQAVRGGKRLFHRDWLDDWLANRGPAQRSA